MYRLILTVVVGLVALALASPASAFQCPKLVAQINQATAQRYDPTASDAKVKAVQAQALHAAGNHAESEKLAKETLDKLK
jgi:predicted kinase